jgi:hypothetical protein
MSLFMVQGGSAGVQISARQPGVILISAVRGGALDHNRDRGEPRGSAPPTPPYIRVRIRRFGQFIRLRWLEPKDAQPVP